MINLVYGSGAEIGDAALASPDLAGIHFTGSTGGLQRHVADGRRRTWTATATTRASSARPAARTSSSRTRPPTSTRVAAAIVRGSFEYQGQKCSAASRVYAPSNLWPALRERLAGAGRDDQDGRRRRLPQLHGRGDRRAARSRRSARRSRRRASARETEIVVGGGYRRLAGLLRRADRDRDARPRASGLLRDELFGPGRDDLRLRRERAGTTRSTWSTRPRRTASPAPCSPRTAPRSQEARDAAALRGRQLLRQRQADRRGRRPAAVRRRARVGHERQGRLDVEPDPLGHARARSRRRSSPPHDYRYPFLG